MSPRDPEQIEREIESSRVQLASTLDTLADRVSPKRLAGDARNSVITFFQTPIGMAAIGGVALLVALRVARKVRNRDR